MEIGATGVLGHIVFAGSNASAVLRLKTDRTCMNKSIQPSYSHENSCEGKSAWCIDVRKQL